MKKKEMIGPSDLKEGQMKVVVYSCKGCTIIVPDLAWNMKGDLSNLPPEVQDILSAPIKNHVRRTQAIVDKDTQILDIPSGSTAISNMRQKGFSVVSNIVIMAGETDSHGNKIR